MEYMRVTLNQHTVGNGVVGFMFAATGPIALLFAAAARGGLSEADIASWVFAAYAPASLLSIGFSVYFRQPLVFAWTIPGTVVVGVALDRLTFNEAIGGYFVTGALIAVLGMTGLARRAMAYVPIPLVMAMVAGLFLPAVRRYAKPCAFWIAITVTMSGTTSSAIARTVNTGVKTIGCTIVAVIGR